MAEAQFLAAVSPGEKGMAERLADRPQGEDEQRRASGRAVCALSMRRQTWNPRRVGSAKIVSQAHGVSVKIAAFIPEGIESDRQIHRGRRHLRL